MTRACETCVHAAAVAGPHQRECRAQPPRFMPAIAGGASPFGGWPIVSARAWCNWHTTEPTGSPPPLMQCD